MLSDPTLADPAPRDSVRTARAESALNPLNSHATVDEGTVANPLPTGASFLKVQGLSKYYVKDKPIFADVNFSINRGEFVCIIGHSGCGKTTILNVLAGLDSASSGYVIMDGREVRGPSLERGVVFQSHALMPWFTVGQNIAFAVKSRWPQWSKAQIAQHVERFVEMVGLSHSLEKKPSELSGGMKQRVGIARAFSIQPKMLLLDEPFGALDALTRGTIQDELMGIVRSTKQTVFMITHDVDEAILLADKIVLMRNSVSTSNSFVPGGIAQVLENPLPLKRSRADLHHLQGYYDLRNHIVDFLIGINKTF
jgi:nitrate/nitrite transport system ATP-binding protein